MKAIRKILLYFSISAVLSVISPLRSSATYYWPLSGSSNNDGWLYGLCSAYGYRLLNSTYDFHHGMDIIAAAEDPVYATFNGIVEERSSTHIIIRESGTSDHYMRFYHLTPAQFSQGDVVTGGNTMLGLADGSPDLHVSDYIGGGLDRS